MVYYVGETEQLIYNRITNHRCKGGMYDHFKSHHLGTPMAGNIEVFIMSTHEPDFNIRSANEQKLRRDMRLGAEDAKIAVIILSKEMN